MHAYLDILFVYPYISWWVLGVIFALSSYEQCCYENLYIVFMGAFVVIHFRGEFLGYLVTLTFKRRTDCFLKWQQCFRLLLMIHEGFTFSYMFTVNVCYCISCLCTHTHVFMCICGCTSRVLGLQLCTPQSALNLSFSSFVVPGIKRRDMCMLSRCSKTKLHSYYMALGAVAVIHSWVWYQGNAGLRMS